jgi:cysteine synthase A
MTEHIVFVEMSATGAGARCIEYSLGRGYSVTLLTRSPETHPSLVGLDLHIVRCDTDDPYALLDTIRSLHSGRRISGVTTTHDLYVPQAALAAEKLGLPGLRVEAASAVRNKHSMRLNLERTCPHLNPQFRLVDTEDHALMTARDWGYPLIAKPQDGNDSWNVLKIDNDAQLAQYMCFSRSWNHGTGSPVGSPGILLEQYIEGSEHSIETKQHAGGEIELLAVTGKRLIGQDDRCFAEAGIYLPLCGPETDILFREVSRALTCLEVNCGVIHTECRIQAGEVKILEINPRLAGDLTGSHMLELAFGASAIEQVVEIALGHPVPWHPTRRRAVGKYAVQMPESGGFGGITNCDELGAQPGVDGVHVATAIGTWCHSPPRSNLDLVARVVATSDTPQEALAIAEQTANLARVHVIHGTP